MDGAFRGASTAFDEKFGIDDFRKMLESPARRERTPQGFQMTPSGERRIRSTTRSTRCSRRCARAWPGDHRTPTAGKGGERPSETRAWQFRRRPRQPRRARFGEQRGQAPGVTTHAGEDDRGLRAGADVRVRDRAHGGREPLMIPYGEDRITPAKRIASRSRSSSRRATRRTRSTSSCSATTRSRCGCPTMAIQAGPYHTNTRAGCSRAAHPTARKGVNKQIFMITDGKPSCMHELAS